jgi:hypothetical protein
MEKEKGLIFFSPQRQTRDLGGFKRILKLKQSLKSPQIPRLPLQLIFFKILKTGFIIRIDIQPGKCPAYKGNKQEPGL